MSQNIDPVEAIDLKNGLVFARHDAALESIEKWSEENFCPLTKARSNKASMTKATVKIVPGEISNASMASNTLRGGQPRDRGRE